MNHDKLMMIPRDRAAVAAHQALDGIAALPAHEQAAAACVLFAVITKRVGLDPEEAFHLGMKLVRPEKFHRKGNAQLEALQEYATLRIKDQ